MTGEISRRGVQRASLIGGTGLLAAAAGCTTSQEPAASSTTGAQPAVPATPRGRVLLAFFSRAGQNYWNGGRRNLKTGNTEVLATLIGQRTGCDIYRIEPADPYPSSYDQTVARNVQEEQDGARPAIARRLPDTSRYDTVLLGSPVWNVRAPMIMSTFTDGTAGLAGKTVLPFVTYAVSGIGAVETGYRTVLPRATVRRGLAVHGETVATAGPDLGRWLRAAGLTR